MKHQSVEIGGAAAWWGGSKSSAFRGEEARASSPRKGDSGRVSFPLLREEEGALAGQNVGRVAQFITVGTSSSVSMVTIDEAPSGGGDSRVKPGALQRSS